LDYIKRVSEEQPFSIYLIINAIVIVKIVRRIPE
jgi:hypothetical protein